MRKSLREKVRGFYAKRYLRRESPDSHAAIEAVRVPDACKTADDFLAWGAIFPWLVAANSGVRLTQGAGSPIKIPGSPDAQPGDYVANISGTLVPFAPSDFEAKYLEVSE